MGLGHTHFCLQGVKCMNNIIIILRTKKAAVTRQGASECAAAGELVLFCADWARC